MELMADQSETTIKSNLVSQWVLMGLLKQCGWGPTQSQLQHQSPLEHGCQFTEVGNLEHTAQPAGNSAGWRASYAGSSAALKPFQAFQLHSASSRKLDGTAFFCFFSSLNCLRVPLSSPYWLIIYAWKRKSLVHLISFRVILKPLSCWLP